MSGLGSTLGQLFVPSRSLEDVVREWVKANPHRDDINRGQSIKELMDKQAKLTLPLTLEERVNKLEHRIDPPVSATNPLGQSPIDRIKPQWDAIDTLLTRGRVIDAQLTKMTTEINSLRSRVAFLENERFTKPVIQDMPRIGIHPWWAPTSGSGLPVTCGTAVRQY